MSNVSFSGPKTCLVCGKPLPRGWRDDVHRECAAGSLDTTPEPNGNEPSASPKSPTTISLHDDIERLVGEGLTKNAIATQLHTSWETITKVCRERGLTPVRGHRGKPLTIKARRKPTEPTPPTAIDKEPAEPGPASELAAARELVCAREQAYQDKFAEMAVAALAGETPDLSLARLAYEYGFAVGGYRVLAAMAEGEVDAAPSGEAA